MPEARDTERTTRRARTVLELAEILGVGKNTAYEAVATGRIKSIRIGKRILVPDHVIDELLAGD
jgi:excisionase family DNA binding protein